MSRCAERVRAHRGARLVLVAAALLAVAGVARRGAAAPIPYDPPEEQIALAEGAGKEVALANCLGCHSADYITIQPRGEGFGRAFWQAEVDKMIHAYGAPIEAADVPQIVDYLTASYGTEAPAGRR